MSQNYGGQNQYPYQSGVGGGQSPYPAAPPSYSNQQQYPPSNYPSAGAVQQQSSQSGYGYGGGGRGRKQEERCCGCPKKTCIIASIVGVVIGLVVLAAIIVGIYFLAKSDKDDGLLSCQCIGTKNCKPDSFNFQSYEKCTSKDQMCYNKYEYHYGGNDLGDNTFGGCRENPLKMRCIRTTDPKVSLRIIQDECWCITKRCIEWQKYRSGCDPLCKTGNATLDI